MRLRAYAGLDLLATGVVLLDARLNVEEMNSAAETLFGTSRRAARRQPFSRFFIQFDDIESKLVVAIARQRGFWDQELTLTRTTGEVLHLNCLATPVDGASRRIVLEIRQIDQQLRIERETRELLQSQASRELIRNLAHEIKNPLGGLRGSAQLLERELDRPDLREYTQVIIKEADRLQQLMERLLTPNRVPRIDWVNIHEVCERVRSLVLAEFPRGIRVMRDYDTSLPELRGDREQLIQAVLNVMRNAADALLSVDQEDRSITLRTRAQWQVTIARKRHRLALELQVIDNGPGIPEELMDRVFQPLVSGRKNGTGLGLTLAQTYVQYHDGLIDCESVPGMTVFRILLPIVDRA